MRKPQGICKYLLFWCFQINILTELTQLPKIRYLLLVWVILHANCKLDPDIDILEGI